MNEYRLKEPPQQIHTHTDENLPQNRATYKPAVIKQKLTVRAEVIY